MSDRPDVVLVTGASRGVGADVAVGVARPGRHVVVNYREKERRAAEVVTAVRETGVGATAVQADLCDEQAVSAMFDQVSRLGTLKALVLNASGGLERHADAGYALRLNRDAQVDLTRRAMAIMPAGAVIVFVTSHPAPFFDRQPVPIAGYAGVAESKHAGEVALRGLRQEFDDRGITFVVVSGICWRIGRTAAAPARRPGRGGGPARGGVPADGRGVRRCDRRSDRRTAANRRHDLRGVRFRARRAPPGRLLLAGWFCGTPVGEPAQRGHARHRGDCAVDVVAGGHQRFELGSSASSVRNIGSASARYRSVRSITALRRAVAAARFSIRSGISAAS